MALPIGQALMSVGGTQGAAAAGAGMGGGISGLFGKIGDVLGSDQFMTGLAGMADLNKRNSMGSLLEAEQLFRAFGRSGGGLQEAMSGGLGADPIGDHARADFAAKLRTRNEERDKKINELLDRLGR
jgi:hypothetical protein